MGVTEERIERIKKQAETLESLGKAAVNISSELDAVLQDNQQMEQQIERLNEANDRLRERLNRSENHDGYMKLPLDADGVPIRIGDEVFFKADNGNIWCRIVSGYRAARNGEVSYFTAENEQGGTLAYNAKLWIHRKLEPSDSWEKLRADLMLVPSEYCDEALHRDSSVGVPYEQRAAAKADDVIARAKKLAGIEEGVE